MQSLEITFQGFHPSELAEQRIRAHVQELAVSQAPILGCRVVVRTHSHHRQGVLYTVVVELRLPDATILVGRERPAEHAHEDLRIALSATFAEAGRRLHDYVRAALSPKRSA